MKKTEIISVICSIIAICISLGALYFQFFYSSNEFVLNIECDHPPISQVKYDAVFINSGTSFVAVTSVDAYLHIFDEKINQNINYNIAVPLDSFVLEPNKMAQKNINHQLPSDLHLSAKKVIAGIEVVFVDSRSVRYKTNIDLLEIFPVEDNLPWKWKHLGTGNINLFKNAEIIEYKNKGGVML